MRTISYFDSEPEAQKVIVVGDKSNVFIRQNIEPIAVNDEDGNERTQWTAVEYSATVSANGFRLTDDFVSKLIAHETEQAAKAVRAKRDALLGASDKEVLPDRDTDKTAWAAYRQALREIPEQAGFPFDVDWPVMPR